MTDQVLHVTYDLSGLDVAPFVPAAQGVSLQGQLNASGTVQGKGFDPQAFTQSLKGDEKVGLANGLLANINVLKLVLSKISMIPGLAEKLDKSLPDEYKKLLDRKDTPLKKVEMEVGLQGSAVTVRSARIEADGFLFTGAGSMDFDQNISLDTSLIVEKKLAASMIAAEETLKLLLDSDGQIRFPVVIRGKVPNVSFFPDLEYLGKRIIVNQGRTELQKVIDKVFKTENQPADPSAPAGSQPQPQKRPEQQILENILDSVFK